MSTLPRDFRNRTTRLKNQTKVRDLFEASYLICRGCELLRLQVQTSRGRQCVDFVFEGPKAKDESNKFKMGHATANVCMLKVTINHLRDLLFQRLREPEIGEQHENAERKW